MKTDADNRPWIVYYPDGMDGTAEYFLESLRSGAMSPDNAERWMTVLNGPNGFESRRGGRCNLWAFGRMDTADFTHVETRPRGLTLSIYWFVIEAGKFDADGRTFSPARHAACV